MPLQVRTHLAVFVGRIGVGYAALRHHIEAGLPVRNTGKGVASAGYF